MRSSSLGEIHHNSVKEKTVSKPIVIEKQPGDGIIEGHRDKWWPHGGTDYLKPLEGDIKGVGEV